MCPWASSRVGVVCLRCFVFPFFLSKILIISHIITRRITKVNKNPQKSGNGFHSLLFNYGLELAQRGLSRTSQRAGWRSLLGALMTFSRTDWQMVARNRKCLGLNAAHLPCTSAAPPINLQTFFKGGCAWHPICAPPAVSPIF